MSSRTFNCIVGSNKDLRNRVFWHRSKRLVRGKTLDTTIPTMRSNDTINIFSSIEFNIFPSLSDTNTVAVGDQTKLRERRFSFTRKLEFGTNDTIDFFGNRLIINRYGKVIHHS